MTAAAVIWHDLECGGYAEDLPLWRRLADRRGGPLLDVGAGTGRVALDLARAGHAVTALDHDAELLAALRARAQGLPIATVLADARAFALGRRFAACLVPMQTVQLLGPALRRRRFLACVAAHLAPGGIAAIALADELDCFEADELAAPPLPDVCEREGIVYCSRPTAVRAGRDGYELERRRETVAVDGALSVVVDRIALHRLTAQQLEAEAVAVGLTRAGRALIAPTDDHVGSVVVMLGARGG